MRAFLSRHRLTLMRVLAALAGVLFVLGTFTQAISPWGPVTLANTAILVVALTRCRLGYQRDAVVAPA
jgi:uncharacterized membrane protein